MKLVTFNGSPKKGINNTGVMIDKFISGYSKIPENKYDVYKLDNLDNKADFTSIFADAEYVLFAFPLYFYSMPSMVKEYIEMLEPYCGKCSDKKIGYLVQYGFPEAVHARPLEKYLQRLTASLGAEYLETIIKGGCDSITRLPEEHNKAILEGIRNIGEIFGKTGKFDEKLLKDFSAPETQTIPEETLKKQVDIINERYWSEMLRKNNVYDISFNKPYAKA